MQPSTKTSGISLLFLLVMNTSSFAVSNIELSGQIGAANLHLGNSTIYPTSSETDDLHETVNPKVPEFSIGANYVIPLRHGLHYKCIQWFPLLKTAVNLRYITQNVNGIAYQYQDSTMGNYQYEVSLYSTRLLLDAILTLFTVNDKTSVYVLAGIGNSWTQVDYQDTALPGVTGGTLDLDKRTNTAFTYEAGAGILYPLTTDTDIFIEYRYAHSPTIYTASKGSLNGSPATITPAAFAFYSQTLALGLNWKI